MKRVPLRQYMALLGQYLKPQWKRVVSLGFFMFAGIGLNLLNPQIVRYFIDTATDDGPVRHLMMAGGIFLMVGIVRQGVVLISSYLGQDVGWRATNQMRNDLALFRPEVSDARMIEILEELGLGAWFAALPQGLDTVQKVDDIMILESGRIMEFGARANLAGRPDSRFSRLLKTGIEDLMS